MLGSFIAPDLAVAPNPLGPSLNLKLTSIPVDAYTFFEFWMPSEHSPLLSEEALLLKNDCDRLEDICSRLIWLFGGQVTLGKTAATQTVITDWQQCKELFHQANAYYDALTVNYLPQAIYADVEADEDLPATWMIRPSTWQLSFWELKPLEHGYQALQLPFSLTITYGQATVKHIESAGLGSRYT